MVQWINKIVFHYSPMLNSWISDPEKKQFATDHLMTNDPLHT